MFHSDSNVLIPAKQRPLPRDSTADDAEPSSLPFALQAAAFVVFRCGVEIAATALHFVVLVFA